ncbi:MAG: zinc ribbon domain-containing protein [Candidatus Lokiarchaeota archaeon]|nr:zinc ribbon domain-containing protein [Candidatus Lokiarchaeota archaeon]
MPGPIRRAIGRAAVRAAVGPVAARRVGRRIARRTARRVFRRRVIVGPAIVFAAAAGGAAAVAPVKMSSTDVQKVESSTGKPVEELTEEDLKAAMKRLGIQKIELTPEEQRTISGPSPAEGEFECSECHAAVTATQKFCPSCGAELQ